MRVALRRLEALARLFRDLPGKDDGEPPRRAARELRQRLSGLRSEEVGRALLAERAASGDEEVVRAVFPAGLPVLRVSPADLAPVVREAAAWSGRLAAAFDGPFAPRSPAERALAATTRRRLRRRLRELSRLLPPSAGTLHAARVAAKRVRYALELVAPLEPDSAPLLRRLRSFQDAAGDAHDLLELAARVRSAAADDPRAGRLLPRLEKDCLSALERARLRGAALERPLRRLRPVLGTVETR